LIGRRFSIPTRVLAGLIVATLSPTAASAAAEEVEARRYADCMGQVAKNPSAAFETAMGWSYQGGGYPARHCAASALLALEHYAEAATRLEQMAEDMVGAEARLRPSVLDQAGRAWMLHGDLGRSLANYTTALELAPGEPVLLVGRSTVLALSGRYWEALDDLNLALEATPDDVGALVMRASAYRLVENAELAMADVERALALQPGHPGALLERGNLRRLIGDDDGARADWIKLLQTDPESIPADAARANLEKLDVKISD
jgi:tetratricopeptide (TPR) repeat protein